MKNVHFGSGSSLSQLLDALEGKLESIAGTLSKTNATMPMQIDDAILKISTILRKAGKIKNSFAPINQLPSETLAYIAAFFATERDLINATVVCQHWRAILFSFPLLWRNAGGSSSEIQAYIERSGSTPIDVSLSSPELAELIVPHTSRLVGLTVRLDDSSDLSQVVDHLRYPISTLHTFRISATGPQPQHTLRFPIGLHNPFFSCSKKLYIERVSAFLRFPPFPHVIEFIWHTGGFAMPIDDVPRILEQFPVLERVSIMFCANMYSTSALPLVTLPSLRLMSLSMSGGVLINADLPRILESLRLPNLTSLCVQAMPRLGESRGPVFPVTTCSERLPNLADLSELQVHTGMPSGSEATFRSPSQATLKYLIGSLSDYDSHERKLWRELPLRSIRRLTVNAALPPTGRELEWLIGLLRDLEFLEYLELGGKCGRVLRRLRHEMAQEAVSLHIDAVTVCGGEYERRQALQLKDHFYAAGLNITLIFVADPGVHEEREVETDGSGDGWDGNDGSE